ncbi:putative 1-alkyl-2-acetylglycerophosphocholine esterase [Lachnellula hyalina]|uniref:1-alkyl-2-acetylglycerophosphocholine esterase n=1 Tax=Lachnellula hyalina TaxID=1316788 RepID=A0A8H8QXD8_9HELO|nr:putative 1-alkyl-2-acetylglycerophosphocholine esterase [Lachnellula hyalina]TVY23900.1 putative 1-alkyl-2-acetylglycerophosphocholine esterase [Lachnellula hyalina]
MPLIAQFQISLILLGLAALSHSIFIPPTLTGSLPIGVVSYELNNTSMNPVRDLMVSIYYPSSEELCKNTTLAPDFSPVFATWADGWFAVPNGSDATMVQRAYNSPPIDNSHYPVLFFSPGYGNSRLLYNGAAQDIASNGYIVVSMDHPNDTDFTVYPDGRTASYVEDDTESLEFYAPFMLKRASDVIFILDHLEENAHKTIPGLKTPFNTSKVGVLGHSLGGATASQVMANDTRFIAGINMDGSVPPPAETYNLTSPFLMLASAGHGIYEGDPSWTTFWESLAGWKHALRVNQTMHHHYSDNVFLLQELRPDGYPANEGFLNGTYMFELESAYVVNFFDLWFKGGTGELFEGPSAKWPEVIFDG